MICQNTGHSFHSYFIIRFLQAIGNVGVKATEYLPHTFQRLEDYKFIWQQQIHTVHLEFEGHFSYTNQKVNLNSILNANV